MKKTSPIRNLRLNLGLSQEKFAKALNITGVAVCYYESNKRNPKIDIAYRILNLAKKNSYPMNIEDLYPRPSKIKD